MQTIDQISWCIKQTSAHSNEKINQTGILSKVVLTIALKFIKCARSNVT